MSKVRHGGVEVSTKRYAFPFTDAAAEPCSSIFSIRSCLIGRSEGSSDDAFLCESFVLVSSASSTSIFLLLPFGAGSRGVRQYVTVRVTTCRTCTLPGGPLALASGLVKSRGEKDALHGAALMGVEEYGEGTEWVERADPRAGEKAGD